MDTRNLVVDTNDRGPIAMLSGLIMLLGTAAFVEGGAASLINPLRTLAMTLGANPSYYGDPAFDQTIAGNAILGAISNFAWMQDSTSMLGRFSVFNLTYQSVSSASPLSYAFLVGARFALGSALGNFIDRISGNAISPPSAHVSNGVWVTRRNEAEQNTALLSGVMRSFLIMTVLSGLLNTVLEQNQVFNHTASNGL